MSIRDYLLILYGLCASSAVHSYINETYSVTIAAGAVAAVSLISAFELEKRR